MIKYIHTFKVSSGKTHKQVVKVYDTVEVATEQYQLLGGKLEAAEVFMVRVRN